MNGRVLRRAALALLLAASPAVAQDDAARTLFNAGAQAYGAAKYLAALQAFEQAYQIQPRPGILFSMAQAHRRQYYIDKNRYHLDQALTQYRQYVHDAPSGNRVADAAQALAELEPIAAKLGSDGPGAAPAPPPAAKRATQLMVSSLVEGAAVTLDGKAGGVVPYIAEVPAGKHEITVTAAGYAQFKREIQLAEGGVVAVDAKLDELPARLTVEGPAGADVSVDGRPVGTVPFAVPVEVSPGTHFIAVTSNGHVAYTDELELGRGEKRALRVRLRTTGQRTGAWLLLGVGAAGLVTGGVFTGLALGQQAKAEDIADRRENGNVGLADVASYQHAIDLRDSQRTVSLIAYGSGLGLIAAGFVLYGFDQPTVNPPSRKERAPGSPPSTRPADGAMEVSVAPVIAPGVLGAGVLGAF